MPDSVFKDFLESFKGSCCKYPTADIPMPEHNLKIVTGQNFWQKKPIISNCWLECHH